MKKAIAATLLALFGLLGVAVTPARAEPVTVRVAVWLNDILKYDPNTGFTVDAYLQFECDRPCGDILSLIHISEPTRPY